MLTQKLKKNFEENRSTYIKVGFLVGVGFILGRNYQRKLDTTALTQSLKVGKALVPNMSGTERIFPLTMSVAEIKVAAQGFQNTTVKDAAVVTINELPLLFVR